MDRSILERKALPELREIAATLELSGYQRMRKADLIDLIIDTATSGSGAPAEAGEDGAVPSHAASGSSGDGGDAPASEAAATAPVAPAMRKARPVPPPTERPSGDGADAGPSGRNGGKAGATRRDEDASERRVTPDGRTERKERKERGQHAGGGRSKRDETGRGQTKASSRDQTKASSKDGDDDLRDAEVRTGVLDLLPEGYGFLRCTGYLAGSKDVYVSQSFVRRLDLRRGDLITGPIRRNRNNDKFPALARVDTVEGAELPKDPEERRRPHFGDLTPLFPDERLPLETEGGSPMAMRVVDLMAPVGKGQRALLVSPPKAGKTTVLKQLANAVERNDPDVHLMVLLVDERPEEVTDFERSVDGEVVSSTFDRPADDHTQVAELTIERAKRLVERGRDVVVLLDSITRLGRAYNLATPASGRILSGGMDSTALYPPKRFFGAARNLEEGGSLTIIATALIETGSKMDEVIFEEFKGTGNMELRLDRRMEQKRIFPAIDIAASGTRREELLLTEGELETVWRLRRLLSTMDPEAALQLLIDKLKSTRSNEQFLEMIARSNLQ